MSDMKCPFCQQKLVRHWGMEEPALYCCDNPKCSRGGVATESAWQELITTRKALDDSEHCCTEWEKQALDYKAENIKLSKVLDYAIGVLHCIREQCLDYAADYMDLADKALEQIESITKGGDNE